MDAFLDGRWSLKSKKYCDGALAGGGGAINSGVAV